MVNWRGNEGIVRKDSRSSIASAPVMNPGLARICLIRAGMFRGGNILWPSSCWLVRYERVRVVFGDRRRLLVTVVCVGRWAATRSEQYISGLGE